MNGHDFPDLFAPSAEELAEMDIDDLDWGTDPAYTADPLCRACRGSGYAEFIDIVYDATGELVPVRFTRICGCTQ